MRSESTTERALRRRQALVSLLHAGPQTRHELVAALDKQQLFGYDEMDDPAMISRKRENQFHRDIKALKLHYQIDFNFQTKHYVLIESPYGFSLNEAQLTALAMLVQTFTDATFPYTAHIQELLAFLMSRLSGEQQKAVVEHRRVLTIALDEKSDYLTLDQPTLTEIERAILRTQQLEFTYHSARTGKDVRHVIEPKPLNFKDGHTYLSGWCTLCEKELTFRLHSILKGTAKMLPKLFQHSRLSPPAIHLRYHLTPMLARNGVSHNFPHQVVEQHPDGSATVDAQITDLFEARQKLLKYGEHCIIESPPALVKQMSIIAEHFLQTYGTPET